MYFQFLIEDKSSEILIDILMVAEVQKRIG